MGELLARAAGWPPPGDVAAAADGMAAWDAAVGRLDPEQAELARTLVAAPGGDACLRAVFGNSPFLSRCILADIAGFCDLLKRGPEAVLAEVRTALPAAAREAADAAACMKRLRSARRQTALGVALADLGGLWDLEAVTGALSDFADAAIDSALGFLLRRAQGRGDLALPDPAAPTRGCGLTVLGMGKLGARELNYSSDIDLIVLYDPEVLPYTGRKEPDDFAVRITRELVRLLEERTGDGHVARVDLRLRPDPAAMPVAIPVGTAETYYESLGQNWERAAMIKARACAGDRCVGETFLGNLRPFVWRRHLDFWAIQDVHSIKRQIHAKRGGSTVTVAGHNIKLGRGGIREIEFFVQTQQLIWGGRDSALRTPRTLDALEALAAAGQIAESEARDLAAAYRRLRRLEHRLQMVADQQTQVLPDTQDGLRAFAAFAGYGDGEGDRDGGGGGLDRFRNDLLACLRLVEDRYAALFEEAPSLAGPGNLVFTGGEPDPETLATLQRLGFADGARVFQIVGTWHRGRYRATRSRRARELLTEMIPSLLAALGRTAQPEAALAKFDEFLAGLPAGVQLFSMLHANPKLLDLLATVMGAAPALADHLSRRPQLLESVLTPEFLGHLPDRAELDESLAATLADARDYQDVLDLTRRWVHDRRFQAGLHLLTEGGGVDRVGTMLAEVAEAALAALAARVQAELAARHGYLPGPGLAVLAFGKLGGREMTLTSDLDLVLVAEAEPGTVESDGAKPLDPGRYFTRLAQRLIEALSAKTAEGDLYEVDLRLRPAGASGPLVTSPAAFSRYYRTGEAWTWEYLALTRARPIWGADALCDRLRNEIHALCTAPREAGRLAADVADMRRRIAAEHPPRSAWQVKYLDGGLIDLEFLAQTLQLRHAAEHPEVLTPKTEDAFAELARAGCLASEEARRLNDATRLFRQVQGRLRLMAGDAFDEARAPAELKQQLAKACGASDFEDLRRRVLVSAEAVRHIFAREITVPAQDAAANTEIGS